MGNAKIYEASRQRVIDLVGEADSDTAVPTCPGWTVKDVVAHLAGSLDAYVTGDMDNASSPEWGNQQVKQRHDRSLEDDISEWKSINAPKDFFNGTLGTVAMADVLAHEQDIRTAIERPGNRDGDGYVDAVSMGLSFLGQKIEGADLPALRFVTEDIDEVVGEGDPQATLNTSTFELFRALHGRRTPDQVKALDWTGDPSPWLEVFFLFGPAEKEIHE